MIYYIIGIDFVTQPQVHELSRDKDWISDRLVSPIHFGSIQTFIEFLVFTLLQENIFD